MSDPLPEYFVGKWRGVCVLAVPNVSKSIQSSHVLIVLRRWIVDAGIPDEFKFTLSHDAYPCITIVPNSTAVLLAEVIDRVAVTHNGSDRRCLPTAHNVNNWWEYFPCITDDGRMFEVTGKITNLSEWRFGESNFTSDCL